MVSKRRWALVLVVCAKIHNVCIDHNVPHLPRLFEDIIDEDIAEPVFNDTDNSDTENGRTRARATDIRSKLTENLQLRSIRRPQFASCNSRE